MYLLNGKKLALGVAFSLGEGDSLLQYPANWLGLSTPEDRAAIGIIDAPDPVRPDDRFFAVTENEDGSYSSTPRNFEMLKREMVAWIKSEAGRLLSASDWKISREAEGVKPCDQATKSYRAAVRAASDANEAAIAGAMNVDDLSCIVFAWPEVVP